MKKIIVAIMTLMMVFTLAPATAFAADQNENSGHYTIHVDITGYDRVNINDKDGDYAYYDTKADKPVVHTSKIASHVASRLGVESVSLSAPDIKGKGNNGNTTAIFFTGTATPKTPVVTEEEKPVVTEPDDKKDEEQKQEEQEVAKYDVVIHYVDENGETLSADVTEQFKAGDSYSIDSPVIEGYTASLEKVESGENGMPAEKQEITVTYTKIVENQIEEKKEEKQEEIVEKKQEETPVVTEPEKKQEEVVEEKKTEEPAKKADEKVAEKKADNNVVIAKVDNNGNGGNDGDSFVTTAGSEEVSLITVADNEVPLGNILDDCCILHLLIMLVACIILVVYTKVMKDRQAHIFELEEVLAKSGIQY